MRQLHYDIIVSGQVRGDIAHLRHDLDMRVDSGETPLGVDAPYQAALHGVMAPLRDPAIPVIARQSEWSG